jgi:hypothetical protein
MNNFHYQREAVCRAATSNKEFQEVTLSACFNFRLRRKGNITAFQPRRTFQANRLNCTEINGNIYINYTNNEYLSAIINILH